DPARLAALKQKLTARRDVCPAFDTDRLTRHIEAAYTAMWERSQRGEPPTSFAVDPRKAAEMSRPGDAKHLDQSGPATSERAETHLHRGALLHQKGRLDEALTSYDRALAIRPDYVEALNNRGALLEDLKRPDDALASYDRAITLNPGYADAHYNR